MTKIRTVGRSDTYSNWNAVNQAQITAGRGGLYLADGEIVTIVADAQSAIDGYTLPAGHADLAKPRTKRLAGPGEAFAMKQGTNSLSGSPMPWDQLPYYFDFPEIDIPFGRRLGSTANGASYGFKHPWKAIYDVYKPTYIAPGGSLGFSKILADGDGIYEIGQDLGEVILRLTPSKGSYNITSGNIYENTNSPEVKIGTTATSGAGSLGAFDRVVSANLNVTPTNARPDGYGYRRYFRGDVTDARPNDEGGINTVGIGGPSIFATYPVFFGQVANPPITGDNTVVGHQDNLGTWLMNNVGRAVIAKGNLPGQSGMDTALQYAGTRPVLAIPKIFGTLARILDGIGANAMGAAFSGSPYLARVTNGALYSNIEYYVYTTVQDYTTDGTNPLVFKFQF